MTDFNTPYAKWLEEAVKAIFEGKELEEPKIVQNARKICDTSNKIIETVEKKPNKLKNIRNLQRT